MPRVDRKLQPSPDCKRRGHANDLAGDGFFPKTAPYLIRQPLERDSMRKMPFACLVAICIPALALPQACPSDLPSLLALGSGSCTVSGLGTLSNFRFSVSSTNGGAPWTATDSPLRVSPGFFLAVLGQPSAAGVGSASSTSTYNLASNLLPPTGNAITGASFSLNFSFGAAAPPMAGGTESLCLNGVFSGFPPTGCSGTTRTLTVPTFNPATQTPQNPAAITFSANSADVVVTGTGTGDLITLGGSQTFTITPIAAPTPTPTSNPSPTPALLLVLIVLGSAGLYLARPRSSRG